MVTSSTSTAASQPRSEPYPEPLRVIVMGVTGCGKTTVGTALAAALGGQFVDGDALHSPASVEKMSHGIPLEDADRWPWFDRIIARMTDPVNGSAPFVVGCSALKRSYRDHLRAGIPGLTFLFLDVPRDIIIERVSHRPGHFMPASLVDSQFATLERPDHEADAAAIPPGTTGAIIEAFVGWLISTGRRPSAGT